MPQIETLAPDQIARFPEFVDDWTKVGLCADPADRPRAEAALRWMYANSKLQTPQIVWCGSPFSNGMVKTIVEKLLRSRNEKLSGSLVRDSVGKSVRESVRESVRDSVRASVMLPVRASVSTSVMASVNDL